MKQRWYLALAILLLLLAGGYMLYDLFYVAPENRNPYDFGLDSIRSLDTSGPAYSEVSRIPARISQVHGIATDKQGKIYLCGKDTLCITDIKGKVHAIIPVPGTANCIHVDSAGIIYLGMTDHILTIRKDGSRQVLWKPVEGEVYITSIATSAGNIFAADYANKIVYRFDQQGKLINRIGQKDPAMGIQGFIVPSPYLDLAVAPGGALWVVNPGRHQLEQYNPDGKLITSWQRSSLSMEGFCGCCNPTHIAILKDRYFITSEKGVERVKLYDFKGNLQAIVALPESFEEGTTGLDLAVGPSYEILVLDPANQCVKVFKERAI